VAKAVSTTGKPDVRGDGDTFLDHMDSQKEVLHGQREASDAPKGMMLVARHLGEAAIYWMASALDKAGEWRGGRP
jgi:hypothetical protein